MNIYKNKLTGLQEIIININNRKFLIKGYTRKELLKTAFRYLAVIKE